MPGFLSLNAARRFSIAEAPRKPLVLYFHKEGTKTCGEQVEILKDPAFAELSKQAGFAWMDTETWPQLRSQLGIYRVPTWIVYNANTQELGRATQVVTIDQLKQFLSSVK
ncbi:MAG TPA: thioredoxin family protein [Candidatus Sumerlaeota bacterium]|nr:thioredoxin family protein [Candidatus Sumerlaeota bacterium]